MKTEQSRARIGILTISDRASQGVYEDRGGPAIRDWLFLHFGQGGTAAILIGGTLLCLRRLMK